MGPITSATRISQEESFGSKEAEEQDLISTVMFHKDYIDELLRLGERDAATNADAIAKLLVK